MKARATAFALVFQMAKVCLVGCVRSKQLSRKRAEDMYASPLFKSARNYAMSRFDDWYILSAKYGLLAPNQEIEPYDRSLRTMLSQQRTAWARRVSGALLATITPEDLVAFVAGIHYRENLIPQLLSKGYTVRIPLEGMSIGRQLQWLKRINSAGTRLKHLDQFYSLLCDLRHGLGEPRTFNGCTGIMTWPQRGVYFIFEPGEYRVSDISMHRVVRIGTHAVSRGSQSTLWNRLRTHKGTAGGGGNHRGSIFRLHVGASLIVKSREKFKVPTWGQGQSASESIRQSEVELERQVSAYMGKMSVLWLDVNDGPSPISDRAYIERNTIALLAGKGRSIDIPTVHWLGRHNPHNSIKRSGLWNVNCVDDNYDPRFLDVMSQYVDVTLSHRPSPTGSIAPEDWYSTQKKGANVGQLNLFA